MGISQNSCYMNFILLQSCNYAKLFSVTFVENHTQLLIQRAHLVFCNKMEVILHTLIFKGFCFFLLFFVTNKKQLTYINIATGCSFNLYCKLPHCHFYINATLNEYP